MSAPWDVTTPAVGLFVKTPAPEIVEMLAAAGLDFIVLDMEHGSIDVRTMSIMISVARGHGLPVFVRVQGYEARDVQPPLDAGADGLFIPHVDSPDVARAVVEACRFPPVGRRGGSTATRAARWGLGASEYVPHANERVTLVAQIESGHAAEVAEQIGTTAGIDAVFFGPYDLALATGLTPNGSEIHDLIADAEARCVAAGVATGGFASGAEAAASGLRFVLAGNDAAALIKGARDVTSDLRKPS